MKRNLPRKSPLPSDFPQPSHTTTTTSHATHEHASFLISHTSHCHTLTNNITLQLWQKKVLPSKLPKNNLPSRNPLLTRLRILTFLVSDVKGKGKAVEEKKPIAVEDEEIDDDDDEDEDMDEVEDDEDDVFSTQMSIELISNRLQNRKTVELSRER